MCTEKREIMSNPTQKRSLKKAAKKKATVKKAAIKKAKAPKKAPIAVPVLLHTDKSVSQQIADFKAALESVTIKPRAYSFTDIEAAKNKAEQSPEHKSATQRCSASGRKICVLDMIASKILTKPLVVLADYAPILVHMLKSGCIVTTSSNSGPVITRDYFRETPAAAADHYLKCVSGIKNCSATSDDLMNAHWFPSARMINTALAKSQSVK